MHPQAVGGEKKERKEKARKAKVGKGQGFRSLFSRHVITCTLRHTHEHAHESSRQRQQGSARKKAAFPPPNIPILIALMATDTICSQSVIPCS